MVGKGSLLLLAITLLVKDISSKPVSNTKSQKNCGANQLSIIEICFCIPDHEWVIHNDMKECRPICELGVERHPITKECQPICGSGTEYDPITKECQPICGPGTEYYPITKECVCTDGYTHCAGLNNGVPVPAQSVQTVELFEPNQHRQAASEWVEPVTNTFSETSTKNENPSADLVSVKDWVDPLGDSPPQQEHVEPVEQHQQAEEVAPQEPVENNAGSTFMNGKSLFADISLNKNKPIISNYNTPVKDYSQTATATLENTDNDDSSSSDDD